MEVARRKGMTGRYLGDAAKLRRAMGSRAASGDGAKRIRSGISVLI
jgi:hypothetical protein